MIDLGILSLGGESGTHLGGYIIDDVVKGTGWLVPDQALAFSSEGTRRCMSSKPSP